MNELLKSLDPNTLVVIGVLLILREVFAFLRAFAEKKNSNSLISATEVELKRFGEIMDRVSENLEAQTKATQVLADSVKELFFELKMVSKDVAELKQHRCESHHTN